MIKVISSVIKISFLVCIGSVLLTSCKDDLTFAEENRTMLDTMFLNRKKVIEAEIDSLCAVRNERFYLQAVDSIMDTRIAEIETRLRRIKNKSDVQ